MSKTRFTTAPTLEDGVETQFRAIDRRLELHDTKLRKIEKRFDSFEGSLGNHFASQEEKIDRKFVKLEDLVRSVSNQMRKETTRTFPGNSLQSPAGSVVSRTNLGVMRLAEIVLPRFCGEKFEDWLFRVEGFFEIHRPPDIDKVNIAVMLMQDKAAQWHQSVQDSEYGSAIIKSWTAYRELLIDRFKEDPFEKMRAMFKKWREEDLMEKQKRKAELSPIEKYFAAKQLIKAKDSLSLSRNTGQDNPLSAKETAKMDATEVNDTESASDPKDLTNLFCTDVSLQTDSLLPNTEGFRSLELITADPILEKDSSAENESVVTAELLGVHQLDILDSLMLIEGVENVSSTDVLLHQVTTDSTRDSSSVELIKAPILLNTLLDVTLTTEIVTPEVHDPASASDPLGLLAVTSEGSSDSSLDSSTEVLQHPLTTDLSLDSCSVELVKEPSRLEKSVFATNPIMVKDSIVSQVSFSKLEPCIQVSTVSIGVGAVRQMEDDSCARSFGSLQASYAEVLSEFFLESATVMALALIPGAEKCVVFASQQVNATKETSPAFMAVNWRQFLELLSHYVAVLKLNVRSHTAVHGLFLLEPNGRVLAEFVSGCESISFPLGCARNYWFLSTMPSSSAHSPVVKRVIQVWDPGRADADMLGTKAREFDTFSWSDRAYTESLNGAISGEVSVLTEVLSQEAFTTWVFFFFQP